MARFQSVKGLPQPGKKESKQWATTIKGEKSSTRSRSASTGRYVTKKARKD